MIGVVGVVARALDLGAEGIDHPVHEGADTEQAVPPSEAEHEEAKQLKDVDQKFVHESNNEGCLVVLSIGGVTGLDQWLAWP